MATDQPDRDAVGPTPTRENPTVPLDTARPEDRRSGRWFRRFLALIGTVGLVIAAVLGLKMIDLWPDLKNPFATEKTDRSGPVLLKSIQDLSRYVAADGSFQVLIDLQENNKYIPDFLFNDRTLFVGAGTVNAYVDFSTLGEGAIKESADGKSVEIILPAPQLEKPNIDHDRSYVFDESRGLANRVGDLFGGDPNRQQQLYQLAEDKIAQAARESELQARAQRNTEQMLVSMLKSLGYENVKVTFAAP
ncbi:DUF4230 domain-containing protein [Luedemannella flava]|uniref:DUF4230 domain-containing protein n=1 Tax=Luedemannella flava TaxID=349316 RepID=A0ABP4XT97_9ACTN